jgi:predicted MFS family arabinose efflux permease
MTEREQAAALKALLLGAGALALAAAVSLGLARFSYALLLPPMRADLGWSYLTAGAMNTVNAAGYLAGALLAPGWLRRFDARQLMLAGGAAAALLLAAHGLVRSDAALYVLRGLTGLASAASFVAGGLLAARLATSPAAAGRSGLVLGIYYGGTGLGIVASALLVPPIVAQGAAAWAAAWWALGAVAIVAGVATAAGTRSMAAPPPPAAARASVRLGAFGFGLAAYLMFGLGYIGYMTFIVTLLRERGLGDGAIVAFYVLLGLGVVASSWIWAGLLQRQRGGVPLAVLNGLLALATVLPVFSSAPLWVFVSGALFGAVFLSVVAATTALVRHNAPPAAWPAGIAAFTVIFAAGQIVGPSMVGWIADGPAGLAGGLAASAGVLALGSLLACRQRPLPR